MGDLTEAIYGLWARSFQLFYCLVKPLRRAGLFQGSLCPTSVSPHPSLTPAIPLSQFTRKTVKVTAVLHTKRGAEAAPVAGKACYQVEAFPTPSPSLFPACCGRVERDEAFTVQTAGDRSRGRHLRFSTSASGLMDRNGVRARKCTEHDRF